MPSYKTGFCKTHLNPTPVNFYGSVLEEVRLGLHTLDFLSLPPLHSSNLLNSFGLFFFFKYLSLSSLTYLPDILLLFSAVSLLSLAFFPEDAKRN